MIADGYRGLSHDPFQLAEESIDRPVHVQDIFATLYHNLSINLATTIPDLNGRPQNVSDVQTPLHELT